MVMRTTKRPDIVVLTGAGISRESGLDTFRDTDGIWARVNLDDVATPAGFARDPERLHQFHNSLRSRLLSDTIRPNAAHDALAKLERDWNGKVLLVSQNVDNLHERAGSINVTHMHGELLKARCVNCSTVSDCHQDLGATSTCAACGLTGSMRPHVAWFGEIPMNIDEIKQALNRCGLLLPSAHRATSIRLPVLLS